MLRPLNLQVLVLWPSNLQTTPRWRTKIYWSYNDTEVYSLPRPSRDYGRNIPVTKVSTPEGVRGGGLYNRGISNPRVVFLSPFVFVLTMVSSATKKVIDHLYGLTYNKCTSKSQKKTDFHSTRGRYFTGSRT